MTDNQHQPSQPKKRNLPDPWDFMASQPNGLEFLTTQATGALVPEAEDYAAVDLDRDLSNLASPVNRTPELLARRKQQATAHKLIRLFAQWQVEQAHAVLETAGTTRLPDLEPKGRLTLDQLVRRYQRGERDFSEVVIEHTRHQGHHGRQGHQGHQASVRPLTKPSPMQYAEEFVEESVVDLTGINLRRANLQHLPLNRVCLRAANLTETNLCGVSLEQSDLRYATLRHANLTGAWLQGADFRGADLRGACFDQAFLDGCDLRGTDLVGTSMQAVWMQKDSVRVDSQWHTHLRRFSLHPDNEEDSGMRLFVFLAQQEAGKR